MTCCPYRIGDTADLHQAINMISNPYPKLYWLITWPTRPCAESLWPQFSNIELIFFQNTNVRVTNKKSGYIQYWHDDVIKWKHFPHNWPFVRGIHRSPVNSLNKGQWREALMFSLICVWINDSVNNREAGDLRRDCTHYDVIVMECTNKCLCITSNVADTGVCWTWEITGNGCNYRNWCLPRQTWDSIRNDHNTQTAKGISDEQENELNVLSYQYK